MSSEENMTQGSNKAVEAISTLQQGTGVFSTVQGTDRASKITVLDAMTNAEPVGDHLGETLELVNVVAQAVSITDTDTGESSDGVRVILMCADGSAYAAVSGALLGSLRDIFGILGEPHTWTEPLPIKVVEQKGRRGYKFFKITIA